MTEQTVKLTDKQRQALLLSAVALRMKWLGQKSGSRYMTADTYSLRPCNFEDFNAGAINQLIAKGLAVVHSHHWNNKVKDARKVTADDYYRLTPAGWAYVKANVSRAEYTSLMRSLIGDQWVNIHFKFMKRYRAVMWARRWDTPRQGQWVKLYTGYGDDKDEYSIGMITKVAYNYTVMPIAKDKDYPTYRVKQGVKNQPIDEATRTGFLAEVYDPESWEFEGVSYSFAHLSNGNRDSRAIELENIEPITPHDAIEIAGATVYLETTRSDAWISISFGDDSKNGHGNYANIEISLPDLELSAGLHITPRYAEAFLLVQKMGYRLLCALMDASDDHEIRRLSGSLEHRNR